MRARQRKWAVAAGLFLLVLVIYWPATRGGFIWDDDSHLTKNRCIIGPLGFAGIWTSGEAVYYPLVLTSFWVIHYFAGLAPLPYHVVTILMHAGAAVTLWRVLLALRVRGAWLGAALWALHPVQVESVAWVTELKNTQSGLFYLLAIRWFLRRAAPDAADPGGWRRYALALLCFAMAITSKSSTVMLPVVLGLCVWYQEGRLRWRDAARLLPFFLLSALASGWTIWEQKFHSGANGSEWALTPAQRLLVSGRDVWFYLGKLAWPHPLIFIYPRWEVDASHAAQSLPGVAVIACLLLFWQVRRGWGRAPFFAFGTFVISLFPVMAFFNVYFFRYSFVGDHFQYLASMGPLALAGAALAVGGERIKGTAFLANRGILRAALPMAVGTLPLAVLALLTLRQQPIYRDATSLWQDTLAKDPRCWMAHNNLGTLLSDEGRVAEALPHFRASVDIQPTFAAHHNNLGDALSKLGRRDEALAELREAVRLDPARLDARNNLGNVFLQHDQIDEAIAQFAAAVRTGPGNVDSRNNLGVALVAKGRFVEAAVQYVNALQIDPADARVRNNLGLLLAKQKRWPDAIAQCRLAVRAKPDYANAWVNLASALESNGQMAEAVDARAHACQLRPDSAQAHYEFGRVLRATGKTAAALREYRRSLALFPDQPVTLNDIAWLLATTPDAALRDGAEAVRLARRGCEITENKVSIYLDTLAAAHAENGNFADAISAGRQASEMAGAAGDQTLADAIRQRLDLYQAGQAYRQP